MREVGSAPERWDVLVVDDEPVVGHGVRLVLGAEGMQVAVVPDAATALAHPALASCRLVVCDLMLPDRPGLDLVRDLRAARPDVPILAITGYATSEHAAEALTAGATEFLAKPFDNAEIVAAVRRAFGASGNGVRNRIPTDPSTKPTSERGDGA